VFGCSVEELFGAGSKSDPQWAWTPERDPCRYWRARVNGRLWLYPVEPQGLISLAHDGVAESGQFKETSPSNPDATLVIASCDPAAGFLAEAYGQATGGRLVVLQRSSRQALELLRMGVVHAAGVHFATTEQPEGNAQLVREILGPGHRLVRVSNW